MHTQCRLYAYSLFFFLTLRRSPSSTLFPYTTLFRSIFGEVKTLQRPPLGYVPLLHTAIMTPKHQPAAVRGKGRAAGRRSEEHTSELQSQFHLVCRLLLEKKKQQEQTECIKR